MKSLKILGICGSLRRQSTNMGLLRYAQQHAPAGVEIKIAELAEVPFYNADYQEKPQAVQTLLADFEQADALLFACPEYNYSLAPALKNALDWASREPDNHLLSGKPAAIMGSGGGMKSGRAQYHLRQVCVFLNLHPLNRPEIFCSAFGNSFDPDGNLIDEKAQELIVQQLAALQDWTQRLRP
ncbi:NADPH-dependent FMN reductase [Pelobacter seleniigenes]|uniref:NADPH-dependent FMN reductase n=1 Tax=Pelobacter seleniigenes TaxID=407188 RepID=UPI0004A6B4BE|nr:NADPH-dependent FMN reductase [Pelobacter seleniigenes]